MDVIEPFYQLAKQRKLWIQKAIVTGKAQTVISPPPLVFPPGSYGPWVEVPPCHILPSVRKVSVREDLGERFRNLNPAHFLTSLIILCFALLSWFIVAASIFLPILSRTSFLVLCSRT